MTISERVAIMEAIVVVFGVMAITVMLACT